jgi:hypothetical protein
MATYIKLGVYNPNNIIEDESYSPTIYIDEEIIQILDEDEKFIAQFTYEELRGIMGIMAAEQEKQHLFIKAQSKQN